MIYAIFNQRLYEVLEHDTDERRTLIRNVETETTAWIKSSVMRSLHTFATKEEDALDCEEVRELPELEAVGSS